MKKIIRIKSICTLLIMSFFISACSTSVKYSNHDEETSQLNNVVNDNVDTNNKDSEAFVSSLNSEGKIEKPLDTIVDIKRDENIKVNETQFLVKSEEVFRLVPSELYNIGINTITPLSTNNVSKWQVVTLADGIDVYDTVNKVRKMEIFEMVDLDYIYETTALDFEEVVTNPSLSQQGHLETANITEGWKYLKEEGYEAGGDSSIVVAVIDTGVDYTHPDLVSNIWINTGEIANNGIDDDLNGFIDDVNGWDFVANKKDPMDDNGHGTHVAGIIGATNNDIGIVGVAYNVKIMPVKAGNSSGYFSNASIASAINYAYMNGADVINMSFGGFSVSIAVQEALESAYTTSILVASAGNESACNENVNGCEKRPILNYPAAFPFVIGVMSTNNQGIESSFTNFDTKPNNNIEYEVFAPGEQILSTMPNGKYAKLSGTSMSAPVVSGIAALLRTKYNDVDIYPSKFIQSQIINTSNNNPILTHCKESDRKNEAKIVDIYNSLTVSPKPSVSLYDYYTLDSKTISENNDDNGVVDAGEKIHIGLELLNKGGMSKDTTIEIDTKRLSEDLTDPYITITKNTANYGSIGTYSVKDGGIIYTDGIATDITNYLEIEVAEDTPHNYLCDINVTITYKNSLDEEDTTAYVMKYTIRLNVTSYVILPKVLTEDTILTKDKKYTLLETMYLGTNVTLQIEPGVEIESVNQKSINFNDNSKLLFNGTKENPIKLVGNLSLVNANNANSIIFDYVVGDEISTQSTDGHETIHLKNSKLREYNGNVASIENSGIYNSSILLVKGSVKNSFIHCGTFQTLPNQKDYEIENNVFILDEDDVGNIVIKKPGMYTYNNNTIILAAEKTPNYYNNQYRIIVESDDDYVYLNNTVWINMIKNDIDLFISDRMDTGDENDPIVDYSNNDNIDTSVLWPYIEDIIILDEDGNEVTTVGNEKITVKVKFNRAMDTSLDLNVTFGSRKRLGDYIINGEYTDEKTWTGTYELKTIIENGKQYFNVSNARASTETFKELYDNGHRHTFVIDTTSAQAMNLMAEANVNGVQLTWNQDDYDTLMGYNIYRSETREGNYVKLNSAVIPAGENTFMDDNVEPGKSYWYSFTVVFSDFSESPSSGRTFVTSLDTINPNIYHTPVNQGYLENNLLINCTATDNVGITSATLYWRVKGTQTYNAVAMIKSNNTYSGKIAGSSLSLDGIEYYIVVEDGSNTVYKGSENSPYSVVIKDASSISYKGDVDGDGTITTKDALMIIQHIEGTVILSDDQFQRADLNSNDSLSASEALRILQYINGNVTTLIMA